VYVNVGLTDAKRPDAQAGLEAAATLLPAAAAGADVFGHMGIAGVDQASSLEMLVWQDEVIGYVDSALREPDFSDAALGLDVVEQVGPGGTFIDQLHTAEHFRRELWFPRLLDRQFYQAWRDAGGTSAEQRCVEHCRDLLASHEVPPLDDDVERALDEVLNAARRELIG
jgi:trimethylamine--corrinoid protein Co-methyltransferase